MEERPCIARNLLISAFHWVSVLFRPRQIVAVNGRDENNLPSFLPRSALPHTIPIELRTISLRPQESFSVGNIGELTDMKRVLVTGGAGFIGSHLVDALMNDGHSVTVVDNLSAGKAENIQHWFPKRSFAFEKRDLAEPVGRDLLENCSVVFHLAANADVRAGTANPRVHFDQNIQVTYNLLEGVRQSDVEDFIFTSTSTVYGDAEQIPTPEDYGPCRPISVYGASKLACESLISAYSNTYGFNAVIYRVANVMGSRSDHGVVHDLVFKLMNKPSELEMYGNGNQEKSYMHVTDCVRALLLGMERPQHGCGIFNLGSEDKIKVSRIADISCQEMDLRNVRYKYRADMSDGRGWPGDVMRMQLDVSKLRASGWSSTLNSEESVRRTVRDIIGEKQMAYSRRN